ncbi:MAG TPA: methylated-DNA--[protein]-cysteine S-methyltransferase [Acidimicrobiales bacterium]|nr:methylated-DNA--[protein]-cysteine S-methyltransferase [Acidimicrobiales bacterium]
MMTTDAPVHTPTRRPDGATATLVVASPVGPLVLHGNERALVRLDLPGTTTVPVSDDELPEPLLKAAGQLDEYFAGQRRQFDVPSALHGTEFQRRVWTTLAGIPYGETISYAELARRVGRPTAFRAVGQANGANPIPIVFPCHRVVASSGGLGGYGGGLDLKRRLLALEGVSDWD